MAGRENGLKVIIDMAKLNVPFQFNLQRHHSKKNPRNPATKCAGWFGPWRSRSTSTRPTKKNLLEWRKVYARTEP